MAFMESSFDPDAIQKLPNTARGLLGVTQYATDDMNVDYDDLGNPETNLKTGTGYLYRRINWKGFHCKGNVSCGLAGYGEGPSYAQSLLNCEKCLKEKKCPQDRLDCLNKLHPPKIIKRKVKRK